MTSPCVVRASKWDVRWTLLALVLAAVPAARLTARQAPPVNPDAKTIADFQARLKTYLEMHDKLESTLPKLPDKATPQEMDKHQRLFGPLIQKARGGSKQGELFTPDMQAFIRQITRKAFSGRDGKQMISSIMDENPVGLKISINGRYPDEVPLSTMPPDLLAALPKLPPEFEFRFVGDRFILLDKHAHLIVDWVENVLPVKAASQEAVER